MFQSFTWNNQAYLLPVWKKGILGIGRHLRCLFAFTLLIGTWNLSHLFSAPRVFTKLLSPLLMLLETPGNSGNGLPRLPSFELTLPSLLQRTIQILQDFDWAIGFQKLVLQPSLLLEFLGLVVDTTQAKVFLPDSNSWERLP